MSSNVTFTATVRLTEKIYQKYQAGELTSLTDESVSAYLEKNFHWRIQALDYTEIPRSSPPQGLNVTVFNTAIEIPQNSTDVPKWTGKKEFKPEIKGNPPQSATGAPLAGNTDGWNATSGTWHWSNTPDEGSDAQQSVSSSVSLDPVSTATPVTTPVGTVTPGAGEAVTIITLPNGEKTTQIVTVVVTVTEGAEPTETSVPTSTEAETSTPVTTPVGTVTPGAGEAVEVVTLPNGEKVTQIVTVVVTVTEGAEPAATSSPTSTEVEISTPVTTPVGTVTPGAGEAVEVVTLNSGEKVTRIVTVVEEVTVYLPAPTA